MKKIVLLIFVFLLSINIFAKTNVERQVEKIREEFVKINSEKNYKIKTVDNPKKGIGTEYYRKNGKLKKVINYLPIANGDSITEYYLKDGKVFFIYRLFKFYETKGYGEVDTDNLKKSEERYYFDVDENLIRFIKNNEIYDNNKISDEDIEEAEKVIEDFYDNLL